MFRAQQNMFDDAVAKATDENFTTENWELILDVCDKASAQESNAKDVVSALIKRLAHRNANVQLYTLELANALSQNCGISVHRELASRSFTDTLLRIASDRNTHQQVKTKIFERMGEWSKMFAKNSDLGIMEQAFIRLKSQNPSLQPPSKPVKQRITDVDRQREEEELQMALQLSIKERQGPAASSSKDDSTADTSNAGAADTANTSVPISSSGTTAATVSRVRALYDFQPSEAGELQFKKGDIIAVLESVYKDWWKGSLRGQTGIFPLNYVEKLADPTADDLQREAQMEAEVFGEIKNVEKLLTLLSTSSADVDVRENEQITTLYHSTLAIRPKLIELIGKYSQRKDDFTQLNEKFIKARRDYEALLEASMAHPPRADYGRPSGSPYPYGMPGGQRPPSASYYRMPDNRTPGPQQVPPGASGPAPFYMAGHAAPSKFGVNPQYQQYSQQTPQQQTPAYPLSPTDPVPQGGPSEPYGRPAQTTYENKPQELGTAYHMTPHATGRRQDTAPSAPQQYPPDQTQKPSYPPEPSQQPQYDGASQPPQQQFNQRHGSYPSMPYPEDPNSAYSQPSYAPPEVPESNAAGGAPHTYPSQNFNHAPPSSAQPPYPGYNAPNHSTYGGSRPGEAGY